MWEQCGCIELEAAVEAAWPNLFITAVTYVIAGRLCMRRAKATMDARGLGCAVERGQQVETLEQVGRNPTVIMAHICSLICPYRIVAAAPGHPLH